MFKNLSDDEKKFVLFWMFVFGSGIAFWVFVVRQIVNYFA